MKILSIHYFLQVLIYGAVIKNGFSFAYGSVVYLERRWHTDFGVPVKEGEILSVPSGSEL